jgi:hypothetical protein
MTDAQTAIQDGRNMGHLYNALPTKDWVPTFQRCYDALLEHHSPFFTDDFEKAFKNAVAGRQE